MDLSQINPFLCSADLLEEAPGSAGGLVLLEVGIQGRNSALRWGERRDGNLWPQSRAKNHSGLGERPWVGLVRLVGSGV